MCNLLTRLTFIKVKLHFTKFDNVVHVVCYQGQMYFCNIAVMSCNCYKHIVVQYLPKIILFTCLIRKGREINCSLFFV